MTHSGLAVTMNDDDAGEAAITFEPSLDEPGEVSAALSGGLHSRVVTLAYALSEGSSESLLLVDVAGRPHFIRGGEPILSLLGLRLDEAVADWEELIGEHELATLSKLYSRVRSLPGDGASTTLHAHPADRAPLTLEVTLTNRLHDKALEALVVRIREADARDTRPPDSASVSTGGLVFPERFRQLLQLAIDRKVKKIWSRSRFARSAVKDRRYDYSLVRLELEQLKTILGGLGQDVIDQVAASMTEQLLAVLRGRDVLTHLGGGEFAILLDGVGDVQQAERVTDVIMSLLDRRIEVAGHAVATSPIVGIATSERRYERAEDVMRDAASAATRARRRRGRKRVAFQTDMRVEDQQRISLMADMHDALDRGDFFLCYQPIVRLCDGQLTGFEALARWTHPERGVIPPGIFIPLAEETGFITKLGPWVMAHACEQLASWRVAHAAVQSMVMSVNLSAAQLTEGDLLGEVEKALTNSGLPPECLNLELTESVVLEEAEQAADVVARLKLYGISFSLDDFGTGYSSLSYLHRFHYDALKIDRSFVGRSVGQQREVMQAIVTLAHALGMRVVGEGVESETELNVLRELGCDDAQGFLFAKPLLATDAEAFIVAGRDREPS